MLKIQYVKDFLDAPNLSNMYAQKFIDGAYGDETRLDELFIRRESKTRYNRRYS